MISARVKSLTAALVWRGMRRRKDRLIWLPAIYGLSIVGLAILAFALPAVVKPALLGTLDRIFQARFGPTGGRFELALMFVLVQAPGLIAVITAFSGVAAAEQSIGAESSGGGIELLLASPNSTGEVLAGILASTVILTLCSWLSLSAATLVPVGVALAATGHHLSLGRSELFVTLIAPLPIVLWSCSTALFMSLFLPQLSLVRTGRSTNLLQTIAALPALLILVIGFARPGLDPLLFGSICFGVGLAGTAAALTFTRAFFRPERLLQNG